MCGIAELDFWNMTIAEVDRAIKAYQKRKQQEDREKASFDYILADLIGKSVSRIYSASNRMPDIAEAYPNIFTGEEVKQKKQEQLTQLSMIRFKQFAIAHNAKMQKGE